jgi:hypothetical protein
MARYIDAEKLTNEIDEWLDSVGNVLIGKGMSYYGELLGCIEDTPTADIVEVKHGYWQDKFNRNRMVSQSFCSVCGKHSGIGGIESNRHKPYCPNCGAKMNGERKCDNG